MQGPSVSPSKVNLKLNFVNENSQKNFNNFLWKIDLIIFEVKQPLFPFSALKYDKKIIEIREVLRVEMSAIIHRQWISSKFYHGLLSKITFKIIK